MLQKLNCDTSTFPRELTFVLIMVPYNVTKVFGLKMCTNHLNSFLIPKKTQYMSSLSVYNTQY